jgi:hypothetical protein
MVVTIIGGKDGKYCDQQSMICNAENPEPYYIMDAGNGAVAFHSGADKLTVTPPAMAVMTLEDAGQGTVALRNKMTNLYCTGHRSIDMVCGSVRIGPGERFKITASTKKWPTNKPTNFLTAAKSSLATPKWQVCTARTKQGINRDGNPCKMTSTLKARVMCPFHAELWSLGATCITNHILGDKHPQCPNHPGLARLVRLMKATCKKTTDADDVKCSRLGMSF